MQCFPYLDKREVLQQNYSQLIILPSPHFQWVVTGHDILEGSTLVVHYSIFRPCVLSLSFFYPSECRKHLLSSRDHQSQREHITKSFFVVGLVASFKVTEHAA